MYWGKYTYSQIKKCVFEAISKNINYRTEPILGLPATYLDEDIFYPDAPFLKNAPFLTTLIENPNHIGCHTITGDHETAFTGTQQLEKELIEICAEQLFGGQFAQSDGYVASGGTEANIQALWIYRNYFMREFGLTSNQIGVIYSEDTHYSIPKAINLLQLNPFCIGVHKHTRDIDLISFEEKLDEAINNGITHFIVVMNMATTMFGTVDDVELITSLLLQKCINFRIHVDAAFGGLIYPFLNTNNAFTFKNPHICSFTIDGHKLLQTPYGTGLFIIRKGYMDYVCTHEAQYVEGLDYTLCGSRSGANAIAVWMILRYHGSDGWRNKMLALSDRTDGICQQLSELGIQYIRNPFLNIVAIKAGQISATLAQKYYLIPDNHRSPEWYKIVVMPHVKQGVIDRFLIELKAEFTHKHEQHYSPYKGI